MMKRIERYWRDFLASLPPDSAYRGRVYVAEGFGDTPEMADELGRLILSGIKTATCSALWEWEAEKKSIPQAGLLSITLDGKGEPICILETTEVTLRLFHQVDEEWARAEGEGDLSGLLAQGAPPIFLACASQTWQALHG